MPNNTCLQKSSNFLNSEYVDKNKFKKTNLFVAIHNIQNDN